jgi:hypothetical protein
MFGLVFIHLNYEINEIVCGFCLCLLSVSIALIIPANILNVYSYAILWVAE